MYVCMSSFVHYVLRSTKEVTLIFWRRNWAHNGIIHARRCCPSATRWSRGGSQDIKHECTFIDYQSIVVWHYGERAVCRVMLLCVYACWYVYIYGAMCLCIPNDFLVAQACNKVLLAMSAMGADMQTAEGFLLDALDALPARNIYSINTLTNLALVRHLQGAPKSKVLRYTVFASIHMYIHIYVYVYMCICTSAGCT
jgi:hypothetical protein